MSKAKGFTLIELLIVIGILAILATTVVLVLNPAQILQESRDTQRMSDLGSVQSAIGLMLATDSSITPFVAGPFCTFDAGAGTHVSGFGGTFNEVCTTRTSRAVNNTGWVGIDLTGTSGGAAIANLPVDPTNNTTYFYAYKGDAANTTYEINARLESTKLSGNMATDGGNTNNCTVITAVDCWYEIGTDPSLDL